VETYGRTRQATDYSIIWRMRFACWVITGYRHHLEFVALIAFPRQQWLGERASMSRLYIRALPILFSLCFRESCGQTYFKKIGRCYWQ